MDGKILLDSSISTDQSVGLAWSSGLKSMSPGVHILNIFMADYDIDTNYYFTASPGDTSTIRVRFDKTSNDINIRQIEGRILRD